MHCVFGAVCISFMSVIGIFGSFWLIGSFLTKKIIREITEIKEFF
jgi:hypothetical protein